LSFPRKECERKGKYPGTVLSDRHTEGTVSRRGKVSRATVTADKKSFRMRKQTQIRLYFNL